MSHALEIAFYHCKLKREDRPGHRSFHWPWGREYHRHRKFPSEGPPAGCGTTLSRFQEGHSDPPCSPGALRGLTRSGWPTQNLGHRTCLQGSRLGRSRLLHSVRRRICLRSGPIWLRQCVASTHSSTRCRPRDGWNPGNRGTRSWNSCCPF